jgi:predicted PurR-regulated permease PerM
VPTPIATPSGTGPTGPPETRPVASPERVVVFRPRAVLIVLGVLLAVVAALRLVSLAKQGLTLIAVALFLALALNPAVRFFQRRGVGRMMAVAIVCLLTVVVFGLLGLVFVPPLVEQITHFVHALPGLARDLTAGRGPLGVLERKYGVVEQIRNATSRPTNLTGAAVPALGIAKGVATAATDVILITFLTLFMLLEGPDWRERIIDLIPEARRGSTQRIAVGVYAAVSGFVTGNLLASLLAGIFATIVLLIAQVPYAFSLGLFTVIIELIPYIGPVIVTVLLSLVALTKSPIAAIIVFALMVTYHLVEGHTLRPLIYGRALKLSPLAVLVAIILGTEIAGILGTLAAIPIAGSIQAIIKELLDQRKPQLSPPTGGTADVPTTL